MIEILNLVRGAVSTKDLVPVLTHFHIKDGRIQGFNGRVAIDAAIPGLAELDATVPAERFLKAVDACDGEPTITITEGKLKVSRKRFKALLSLMPGEDFPLAAPTKGAKIKCPWLLSALGKLEPFVGEDASRTWVCSLLFRKGFAWATTNTIVARVETGAPAELDIAVPEFVAQELLRIGKDPEYLTTDRGSITFHYKDKSWVRGAVYQEQWPDMGRFERDLEVPPPPIPPGFGEMLRTLETFVKDPRFPVVLLGNGQVSTEEGDHSAAFDGFDLPETRYDLRVLRLVVDNATHALFNTGASVFRNSTTGLAGIFTSLRS